MIDDAARKDTAAAPRRSYHQYCAIARALDVVGERWTLLLVRELMPGAKRFKDLAQNLAGIGANLLSARLQHLEREGVVQRATLPPPASVPVYELTALGRGLEPVLQALGAWALPRLGARGPRDTFRPAWLMQAVSGVFNAEAARGLDEVYEYRVDGEHFHLHVHDGVLEVRQGAAPAPDLVIHTDTDTLLALAVGEISPQQALSAGSLTLEGQRWVFERSLRMFAVPGPSQHRA